MKTSLEYLPEHKRNELKMVLDLIVEEMEPEMVILFGSYATNKWVEDRYVEEGITYEYKSDFDILVISHVELGPRRVNRWRRLEDAARKLPIETPVSLIHHGIKHVNKEIRKHNYFFTDILKEGVMLYNRGKYELTTPGKMNPKEVQSKAKEDFEMWFESANTFFKTYNFNFSEGDYKVASFQLHQAVERYYTALLLVFTGYRPKTHDIRKLGEMALNIDERFKDVFPLSTAEEVKRFDLLKRAYIEARYKRDYEIGKEELEYLNMRVEVLRELVKVVCGGRLKSN